MPRLSLHTMQLSLLHSTMQLSLHTMRLSLLRIMQLLLRIMQLYNRLSSTKRLRHRLHKRHKLGPMLHSA